MERKDYLKACRYYGKSEHYEDPVLETFASLEYQCLQRNLKGASFSEVIKDYADYRMSSFCQYDDTPLTLKAYLFNRFMYHTERIDIDAFKDFYRRYVSRDA